MVNKKHPIPLLVPLFEKLFPKKVLDLIKIN